MTPGAILASPTDSTVTVEEMLRRIVDHIGGELAHRAASICDVAEYARNCIRCGLDEGLGSMRLCARCRQHIAHRASQSLCAIDDERRQTQRRMIAALYWRAGAMMLLARHHQFRGVEVDAAERDYWQRQSDALTCAARLMEAAL